MSMIPHLTPTVREGNSSCCFCPTTAPTTPCEQPATWHVAWSLTPPVNFSLVCNTHMAVVQEQLAYVDRHPAAIACDMPGTGWLPGDPSRCVIVSSDDVTAASHTAPGAVMARRHTVDSITDDALDALYANASKGWRRGDIWKGKAIEIEADRDRAAAAIERARALHKPMGRGPFTICTHCSGWNGTRCLGVVTPHPCDTLYALDEPTES